ncbi:MAG: DMT family transporter [Propionibacteriaceae bacterium]|nr:DMT family transporter [Propionibacteriaceae bacterium]
MRSVLIVILAAVLFGTTGTTGSFAPAGASPLSVGAARMVAGGALMALVGWLNWRRRAAVAPGPARPDPTRPDPTGPALPPQSNRVALPTWLALAGAGFGMAAYQWTFFAGVRANGVAVGTIVTLGASPLWAGLFEWLIRGRSPRRPWLIATGLAVVGVVLLSGGSAEVDFGGVALSATAGAAYALELVMMKIPLDRGWSSSDAVSWVMGLAGLASAPVLIWTDTAWLATWRGAAVVGWLSLVTIVVAYQLLAVGLKRLPAATITTLTLAEPATATLLGLIVLQERLTQAGLAGVVVIVAGLAVLALAERRPRP